MYIKKTSFSYWSIHESRGLHFLPSDSFNLMDTINLCFFSFLFLLSPPSLRERYLSHSSYPFLKSSKTFSGQNEVRGTESSMNRLRCHLSLSRLCLHLSLSRAPRDAATRNKCSGHSRQPISTSTFSQSETRHPPLSLSFDSDFVSVFLVKDLS